MTPPHPEVGGWDLEYHAEHPEIPDGDGHPVRFHLRRPVDGANDGAGARYPVLIILAGIKTGDHTLERLPDHGANVLIAYAYPYDKDRWGRSSTVRRGLTAHWMTYQVSKQIIALVRWLHDQPWADPERINIGGGSLGSIVLPMILSDMQRAGVRVRSATFAYGGVGRFTLGYQCLRHRSFALAVTGAILSWLCLGRLEPARYLPHLSGEFLVISSPDDQMVPRGCAERFESLLPDPKTIVHMEGGHVDIRQPDVLADVVAITLRWLVERGAFDGGRGDWAAIDSVPPVRGK